jgi:hypothetical protein
MRTLVIYPGRFQPGHLGHKASYDYLVNKFGANNVYIATSDVVAPVDDPFDFNDKITMLTNLGIPASHIVKVRSPYRADEIIKDVEDPTKTALIFAVSEKDMSGENPRFKFGIKKNGEPSYMQPYPADGKKLKPLTKHAYVMVTPTVKFKVKGKNANSATLIRQMYRDGNEVDRKKIIHDLYGKDDQNIKDIFDKKLGVAKKTRDIIIQQPPIDANVLDTPAPLQREYRENRKKLAKLLESIQQLEKQAKECYLPMEEELIPNYIDEKNKNKIYW